MYNGYTNYETWSVMVTIDNTQSLYNYFKDMVHETETISDEIERKSKIIHITKQTVENMMPKTTNLIWAPLLNSLLEDHINFSEIADSLLAEYS